VYEGKTRKSKSVQDIGRGDPLFLGAFYRKFRLEGDLCEALGLGSL